MKFSVIIPCFNVEKYITDTIESILNQNYKNFEIILVNDGSTDKTISVFQGYKKDNNILIIDKVNEGVSSARNKGIEYASGDYFLFLDGDDVILPNLLIKLSEFISKNNFVDILSFGYEIIKMDGKLVVNSSLKFHEKVISGAAFLNEYLKGNVKQCMCSFVVKKTVIKEFNIRFDEGTFNGEDQEFQIKCMLNSKNVAYLATPYFKYIMRSSSAVNSKFSEKYLTLIDVFYRLLIYTEKKTNDKKIINNLKKHGIVEFFFVFRKAIKANDVKLVKKVQEKDKIVKEEISFEFNKKSLIVFLLRGMYLHMPNVLIKFFKRI
jgi:glycosyltransferase involved in cell wall biosynthesis